MMQFCEQEHLLMEYIVPITAFAAALLTFFSGFGLGTLLTPVMACFFPLDVAIGLTAIVHLLNNFFKLILVGKHAQKEILLKFGVPAVIAAVLGAWLLLSIQNLPVLTSYQLNGRTFEITSLKLIFAVLLVLFTLVDYVPSLSKVAFGPDKLVIGGILSGFFGGLTGNQGALRSAFLVKAGLSKEAFIATGTVVSTFLDLARISVYAAKLSEITLRTHVPLLLSASIAAFAGAYLGSKLLKKVTLAFVQHVVAIMLLCIALALGVGLI
jgi:uncharacterized protein